MLQIYELFRKHKHRTICADTYFSPGINCFYLFRKLTVKIYPTNFSEKSREKEDSLNDYTMIDRELSQFFSEAVLGLIAKGVNVSGQFASR